MRTLYFDCFSGAAGDMILGALIDAGAPEEEVRRCIDALALDGCTFETRTVSRSSLRALKVDVVISGPQPARGPREIRRILDAAALPDDVGARAMRVFDLLARAEATVHGIPVDDVHFHEVGAVDALADVVGCAAALESLHVERVVTSPIATGRGLVEAEHGTLPLPAPAVVELLRGARLQERGSEELVTPTGAAVLAEATDEFGALPPMTLVAAGYGAGTRDAPVPNVVRVLVGDAVERPAETLLQIEANVDDMNPELLPYAVESLLAAGAADAWITPVLMKKGRPGFVVSALAEPGVRDRVVDVFLRETTTFGVRTREVEREVLERSWVEVDVEGHPVRVKVGARGGSLNSAAPEHEDARRVAKATGMPLKDVYARAMAAAQPARDQSPRR